MAGRSGRWSVAARAREQAEAQAARREEVPIPTEPPSWLGPVAAELWREYLPRVIERTTAADAETFAQWCHASADVRHWSQSKAKMAGESLRASLRIALAHARDLGLTPISRARLPAREKVDEQDLAEATLASRLA